MEGVQSAVLGLLVAESDYAFSVAKRLEGSASRAAVYKAVERLQDADLIEAAGSDGPRKYFQVTPEGLRFHAAKVAEMLSPADDIAARLLAIPAEDRPRVLDEYEERVLAAIAETPLPSGEPYADLIVDLQTRQNQAALSWIPSARRVFGATEA